MGFVRSNPWLTGHFVRLFTKIFKIQKRKFQKNLIQSVRMNIIGIREEKREERYDETHRQPKLMPRESEGLIINVV